MEENSTLRYSRAYALKPAVAVESFQDGSLALNCVTFQLVRLNATASDLLSRLEEPATLDQLAAAMALDYDQPVERIHADVELVTGQMVEMGLVDELDTPADPGARLADPG